MDHRSPLAHQSVGHELVDTTVKHDDDLNKMYKIPVFGEIMDFEQNGDDTDETKK